MKTNIRLWQYRAQFFLESETFQTNIVDKSKEIFYVQYVFFFKSRHL